MTVVYQRQDEFKENVRRLKMEKTIAKFIKHVFCAKSCSDHIIFINYVTPQQPHDIGTVISVLPVDDG